MHKAPDVAHAPAVPVATAVFAVLAAIGSVVSNQSASQALFAKNEAILARSDASDAYTSYEAHEVRAQIYAATLETGRGNDAATRRRLETIVDEERRLAAPYLERAETSEDAVRADNARSERLTHAHDLFDIAIALVEIAVAIVSISALAESWYLAGFAGACALAGVATFVVAWLDRPG